MRGHARGVRKRVSWLSCGSGPVYAAPPEARARALFVRTDFVASGPLIAGRGESTEMENHPCDEIAVF